MEKTKLPQELSLDELLNSIEGQEITKEEVKFTFSSPVLSFIQAFKISEGPNNISGILLYELFKLWNKDKTISARSFHLQIGKYIPAKLLHGKRYYKVNTKVLKVAEKIDIARGTRKHTPTKSKAYHRHYTRFLTTHGLDTPGKVYLELDIFYYIYNNWCDSIYKRPVSYSTFSQLTRLFFSVKKLNSAGIFWVGLNPNIKSIATEQMVKNWREGKDKRSENKDPKAKRIKKQYEKHIIYKATYKKR